nr:DUF3558 family protein [Aldersonia kunmingensis]
MTTAAFAVAVCGLAVTGCSTTSASGVDMRTTPNSVSKSAQLDSPEARTALWNPCNIPNAAMGQTDLEIDSEEPDVVGMLPLEGARTCGWSAGTYDFVIYSTTLSPSDVHRNPHFRDFAGGTVGTKPVVKFRDDLVAKNQASCTAAFATYQGEIFMSVVTAPSTKPPKEDACVTLERTASSLVSALPK